MLKILLSTTGRICNMKFLFLGSVMTHIQAGDLKDGKHMRKIFQMDLITMTCYIVLEVAPARSLFVKVTVGVA